MKPTASDLMAMPEPELRAFVKNKGLSLRPISEAEWQAQVVQIAELHGFLHVHFRPAQTSKGWRTPVSGPLGKGWVDLVLAGKGRLLFVELKRDGARPSEVQEWVMSVLRSAGAEVHVWSPKDFDEVVAILQA